VAGLLAFFVLAFTMMQLPVGCRAADSVFALDPLMFD
jgi:hypothetical protein